VREHDDFVIASMVEEGLLDAAAAALAQRTATEKRVGVCDVLVERGLVTEKAVAVARAGICEVPYVDITHYQVDLKNTGRLSRATAEALCALPLFVIDGVATVGMADPMDLRGVDQLRAVLKLEIEPVLCEVKALQALIDRVYSMSGGSEAAVQAAEPAVSLTTGKEPVVAAVNQIITQAVERGASDVHIGPDENRLHLRYRVDGGLQVAQGPPLSLHSGIVQRLKVMANLDLTQTRRPQDGKFRFTATTVHGARSVDIRLSLIPTVCGENVVMRLLTNASSIKDFPELGLVPAHVEVMEDLLRQPNGMILVTGPTGSGKTTTLYAALSKLNSPERNVVTIEDPVEIRVPMIRQVQTNAEIGLTFAGALRSILRQDPDVVLVGEIRDEETARIAMQAALTGHLVLSSLHTNDAPGAIPRLLDFHCPTFAIGSALLGVVAQRLARRVCNDCTAKGVPSDAQRKRFNLKGDEQFASGAGCARCVGTGYKGRVGLYEVLRIGPGVQAALEGGDAMKIRRAAIASGMRPMWMDGLDKARLGMTTLDEVARIAAIAAIDEQNATNTTAGDTGSIAA
jgi:type IV pilus assembly protein PilB